MKSTRGILSVIVLLLSLLPSCLKEADETILVNDPQKIPFITEGRWSRELLGLFGEENVCFGDTPPHLECGFVSSHQYVATNLPPGLSPEIGSVTPVAHYHKFRGQYIQICEYQGMVSGEDIPRIVDTAYVMGHDSCFTAYWVETRSTVGIPTLAVVMSGELAEKGIVNYRYGYQIIGYADDDIPANVYPVNSIFVFRNTDSISEYNQW